MRSFCLIILTLTFLLGTFAGAAAAPKESVIAKGLVSKSNLVGHPTTGLYGVNGNLIYRLSPPTASNSKWTTTTLYSLRPKLDGITPGNLFLGSGGVLYGTTLTGGTTASCCGTVFALKPNANRTKWTFSVLYRFKGGKDGGGGTTQFNQNLSQLTADQSGALYGSTMLGGAGRVCCGTIFKLIPPAAGQTNWTKATLYAFQGSPDGITPVGAPYLDGKGNLFGVTLNGGSNLNCDPTPASGGCGTIFELVPPTAGRTDWTEVEITPSINMVYPYSTLVADKKGALYGTAQVSTQTGSKGFGIVFRVTGATPSHPNGTFQDVYDFANGSDGSQSKAGLTIDGKGTLYGTTMTGGTNFSTSPLCLNGCGTVFKLTPTDATGANWKETIVHRFNGPDGEYPTAPLLIDGTGALYGTASPTGYGSDGLVFKIVQ